MIWWLAAAAASVVKSHWKTEIINLVLTGVLLILVVAACSAWLSFLPENSYGCLEEMWLVSNKWLFLVGESNKIPCQLRFEPAVKWYNLIMALLILSCRSNCHRTRVDSPFMTFVIFHEESQHFRKGDETDTKCFLQSGHHSEPCFSCRVLGQILSKKSKHQVFIPDGVALFGPRSNVGSLHRPGTTWVSGSTSRICWLAVTQKQNACSYGWSWFNVIFAGKKRQTMANPYLLPRLFASASWALIAVLQSWSVAVTFAQCCSYQVEAMVHIHCLEQFELCYLFLLCGCAWLLGLFRTGWTLHCTSHRNLYHL